MHGKRVCHVHGGRSTGPRTREGKAAVVAVHLKHGRRAQDYTAMQCADRERVKALEVLGRAVGLIDE
jgi:hypothetical protein